MELSFTARQVLLGASLLGIAGGTVGCFALLRRQSLLGDALAHAALPGVCLGYLLTGSKEPLPLFLGALVAGVVGALVILAVVRGSRIKEDAAIGIVLSVFFGLGIVLLTYIQRLPAGNQSGLDRFLFGQAATLVERDVIAMAALCALVLLITALFYKELKILSFDPDFGESLGFRVRALEVLFTLLLVTVVVVGLQTVGVVLIVAALVTPAAAARQWTESLAVMILAAAAIGGASGALGAMLSASVPRLPTGPVIVLAASAALVVSLLLAPRRGLLWARLAERRVALRIRLENLLKDLYSWSERPDTDDAGPVPWPVVMGFRGQSGARLGKLARELERRGLAERRDGGLGLSRSGLVAARGVVRKHRLWELYLSRSMALASDHVHAGAELMEHALDAEAVALLEERLGYPTHDPHGRPIPAREEPA